MQLEATTKLDAINIMLSSIGSDPITTLEDTTDIDVHNAIRLLDKCSKDIQRQGWDFNQGGYTFKPDKDTKRIAWNKNILKHSYSDGTIAKRGDFFYDMENQTFEFKNPIEVTITVALDFEDLPECFRNYITAKATVAFQMRYFPDPTTAQQLQAELVEIYQDIVDYDIHMGNYNMLSMTHMSEVLQRS